MKKRVLSGIRATGRLHLGNYFGMVKGMVGLQEKDNLEPFFMVADLHALTTPFNAKELKNNVRDVVLDYLSAGLDPEKAILFIQSHIPEHIELSYLFSTQVSIARLSHLPTFKEKVKQYPENNTMALLYYPILMASDILLYKTDELPVGDDQLPHLEIAREIARKMNSEFGTNFPEPKQMKMDGQYLPSLTGEGKMSKSVEGSFVNLTDDLETIKKKLAKTPTDSGKGEIKPYKGGSISEENRKKYVSEHSKEALGVAALMEFIELFQGKEKRKEYEKQYESTGIKYSELKESLAEAIYEELKPFQEKRRELEKNPEYVDKVIKEGAERARKIAQKTVNEVKQKMGLK